MHLLAGQFVHVQSHRTFLVTLLVVLRHVHVALSVARVISHPHSHWSASNCQLSQQHDTVRWNDGTENKSIIRWMKDEDKAKNHSVADLLRSEDHKANFKQC